jgi:hypothetical protein
VKIAVYAIALNEAAFAERFVAGCRGADLILVADTGSTDGTRERLRALGVEVRGVDIHPWRFDVARNAALGLLPRDVDVCISLDLDQTLAPGWRDIVERVWRDGVNRLCYGLVYRPAGEGGEESFLDNRIHARVGFSWRYPCHECLEPDGDEKIAFVPDLRIIHQPDEAKSRAGYLPLLELAAREAPGDPRCAHYLGRELYDLKRYAEAAAELERYFALPSNGFEAERNATRRYLAHCREALGEPDAALAMFRRAVEDQPGLRGAWVELAWACHRRQAWAECLAAAERAIAFPDAVRPYGDDTSPGVVAEDLACLAAWSLGRPREALAYARIARAKAPASARIHANLERIEAALARDGAQAFGVSMTPLKAGKS